MYSILRNNLTVTDTKMLDHLLLDERGLLKVVDAGILHAIPRNLLLLWAQKNAVYQFITFQMIEWLKPFFAGKSGLETCSGNGTIGRALNIPSTDSRLLQSNNPLVQLQLLLSYEQPTNPPEEVLKMESNEAVDHLKPDVVVGAYVSQLYREGDDPAITAFSLFGTDEELLFSKVSTYITFGNKETHKNKRIYRLPHQELYFPWLINRSHDQTLNRVWVWQK